MKGDIQRLVWHQRYTVESVTHYGDVIMDEIASQITSLTIVYSTVYSDEDQRKHQSSASLAFVRGIHRGPVNSPHKWPVTRKMFPFDDVIMGELWGASHVFFVWKLAVITSPHCMLFFQSGRLNDRAMFNTTATNRIHWQPRHDQLWRSHRKCSKSYRGRRISHAGMDTIVW